MPEKSTVPVTLARMPLSRMPPGNTRAPAPTSTISICVPAGVAAVISARLAAPAPEQKMFLPSQPIAFETHAIAVQRVGDPEAEQMAARRIVRHRLDQFRRTVAQHQMQRVHMRLEQPGERQVALAQQRQQF